MDGLEIGELLGRGGALPRGCLAVRAAKARRVRAPISSSAAAVLPLSTF